MAEHYTRGTLETTAWCNRCGRNTRHRVDGVRKGPCLEHEAPQYSQAQLARQKKQERERLQPALFEELKR